MSLFLIVILVVALLAVGGGVWYFTTDESPQETELAVAAESKPGGYTASSQPSDLAPGSAATTATALEPSKYKELKRIDWTNNDITAFPTSNLSACEQRCDSEGNCKGFYAKMPGGKADFCWLKSRLDAQNLTRISEGSWNDGSFFVKPGTIVPPF